MILLTSPRSFFIAGVAADIRHGQGIANADRGIAEALRPRMTRNEAQGRCGHHQNSFHCLVCPLFSFTRWTFAGSASVLTVPPTEDAAPAVTPGSRTFPHLPPPNGGLGNRYSNRHATPWRASRTGGKSAWQKSAHSTTTRSASSRSPSIPGRAVSDSPGAGPGQRSIRSAIHCDPEGGAHPRVAR